MEERQKRKVETVSILDLLPPCRRIAKNLTLSDEVVQIGEECGEVAKAVRYNMDREIIGEELVDVIQCCITALDKIGYDAVGRINLAVQVYNKNKARGYYEEEQNDSTDARQDCV